MLLEHFIKNFERLGSLEIQATKSMIGISNGNKKVAWITQIGKDFIHVVFPFKKEYTDQLCFQKIARVPGNSVQFNHHFRMLFEEDVNSEVLRYMTMALNGE